MCFLTPFVPRESVGCKKRKLRFSFPQFFFGGRKRLFFTHKLSLFLSSTWHIITSIYSVKFTRHSSCYTTDIQSTKQPLVCWQQGLVASLERVCNAAVPRTPTEVSRTTASCILPPLKTFWIYFARASCDDAVPPKRFHNSRVSPRRARLLGRSSAFTSIQKTKRILEDPPLQQ